MPDLGSCIPFPIDEETLNEVISKAKDWAIMHGAAMRSKADFSEDSVQFAPFILLPTLFPRREFEKAVRLQPILNELMHWVAHDTEFLRETLANTIKVDEFTRNLFNIYEKILADESAQETRSLGLFRSDYMVHSLELNEIKQVEFNTIASSFAGISSKFHPLHSFVLSELNYADKVKNLPLNGALAGLCEGMVEAWNLQAISNAAILFVVEGVTYNICDQRFHEFYIREKHPHIKVIRKTLTEIHQQASLGPNNELKVNDTVISVVYFRAGYEPGHYPSQNEWDARYLIEKSVAIKCPSIGYHLAGTKKVQQALAKPGILKRFLTDDIKIKAITDIFTGLYSMDSNTDEGQNALRMVLTDPAKYVLKPQREGGGNNVYGHDIPDVLRKMSEVERSAWILMERIFPPISKGYMIRPSGPSPPPLVDLVSELGIFGAVIGDKKAIVYNAHCGHMLRTKLEKSNEGGVAAGSGALDSPYLYDD
ncbi:glutathione synthetase-like isoform X2 [Sitodiplosis mosellana]|uniref:glutathione synthetase-like isoform X2 n=1 Tax=Sitodiplosis mosellana TaxID=263140 RepID=UPI0024444D2B|nr:glutathione synthetase-like isoform X2 [Sitodiplosis mosellana]